MMKKFHIHVVIDSSITVLTHCQTCYVKLLPLLPVLGRYFYTKNESTIFSSLQFQHFATLTLKIYTVEANRGTRFKAGVTCGCIVSAVSRLPRLEIGNQIFLFTATSHALPFFNFLAGVYTSDTAHIVVYPKADVKNFLFFEK